MWGIALVLKVASYFFWPFVSFQEAVCYFSICNVQSIITTTRFLLKWNFLCGKLFTANCYALPFYSQYCYSNFSQSYSFIILWGTPAEVNFLLLSIELWLFSYFYYVLYYTVMEHGFSYKYRICSFVIFPSTTFLQQSEKSITYIFGQQQQVQKSKYGYTTKQSLKYGALSGVIWLWWGRSWLRRKLSGLR